MNDPSDKSTIPLAQENELSVQDLDKVTGGDGKAPTRTTKGESPKETITFEYGGLQVFYSQQQAD